MIIAEGLAGGTGKQSVNPFGVDDPPFSAERGRDPWTAAARPFQSDPLDGVAQVHVAIRPWRSVVER
jgi:hypothetical protein